MHSFSFPSNHHHNHNHNHNHNQDQDQSIPPIGLYTSIPLSKFSHIYFVQFHFLKPVTTLLVCRISDHSSDFAYMYFMTVPQIIILAHSLGGMVARTSVLLSNYPRRHAPSGDQVQVKGSTGSTGSKGGADEGCGVSDIIMLSTPNNRYLHCRNNVSAVGKESV